MSLTHDDAVGAISRLVASYKTDLAVDCLQLLHNLRNKYALEKIGFPLISSPDKPSLPMMLRLVDDSKWATTYVAQDLGLGFKEDPTKVRGFCVDDLQQPDSIPKRRICINKDTATFGTLVHEFLHLCTSVPFSKATKAHKLLYEGPTEYFTRKAVPTETRQSYLAEHHVIDQLVSNSTLPEDKLRAAYFTGDEKAIKETLARITLEGQKPYSKIYDQVLKLHGKQL